MGDSEVGARSAVESGYACTAASGECVVSAGAMASANTAFSAVSVDNVVERASAPTGSNIVTAASVTGALPVCSLLLCAELSQQHEHVMALEGTPTCNLT